MPLAGAPLQPLEYFPVKLLIKQYHFHYPEKILGITPQVGFEPTTDRLTADSSTTELLRNGGPKWTRTTDLTLIRRAL